MFTALIVQTENMFIKKCQYMKTSAITLVDAAAPCVVPVFTFERNSTEISLIKLHAFTFLCGACFG